MASSGSATAVNRIILFLTAACLVVAVYVFMSEQVDEIGYPTDDSWIHQVYARNLAEEGEWSFVLGEPSVGSTAPFYMVLLAVGRFIGISHFLWVFVLGAMSLILAAEMGARLTRLLFPQVPYVGVAAGLAIILSWQMAWAAASGMETMLFTALILANFYVVFHEVYLAQNFSLQRGIIFGMVAGCLTLTRPEGILTVGIAVLFGLLTTSDRQRFLKWGLIAGVVWAILVSPYLAWNYHVIGEILPSTAKAKMTQHSYLRDQSLPTRYLNMTVVLLLGAQMVVVPASLYGFWHISRKVISTRRDWLFLAPAIWGFAHLTLYVIQLPSPNQNGRYVMPIQPIIWLYAVGGLALLVQKGQSSPLGRIFSRTYALSSALLLVGFLYFGGLSYANQVRAMNTEMVAAAKWVKNNVPENDLFAVHDIGALGYFAPRKIVDIAGLVNPEVVPFIDDGEAVMAYICGLDARWLMALPDQRPVEADDPRVSLVYESDTTYLNDLYASNETGELWKMRVYQLDCPEH